MHLALWPAPHRLTIIRTANYHYENESRKTIVIYSQVNKTLVLALKRSKLKGERKGDKKVVVILFNSFALGMNI